METVDTGNMNFDDEFEETEQQEQSAQQLATRADQNSAAVLLQVSLNYIIKNTVLFLYRSTFMQSHFSSKQLLHFRLQSGYYTGIWCTHTSF